MIHAVKTDPYFKWLQENAVENRRRKNVPGVYTLSEAKLEPENVKNDLIEELIQELNYSIRPTLKVVLAQVIRNHDPLLTPEQIRLADHAYHSYLAIREILSLGAFFESPGYSVAAKTAWNLAPNLSETRKNLQEILVEQARRYGSLFPRRAFEKIRLTTGDEPEYQVFRDIWIANHKNGGRQVQLDPFRPRLEYLRALWDLPVDYPIAKLMSATETIFSMKNKNQSSYEEFLGAHFSSPELDFTSLVRNLRTIIEAKQLTESDLEFSAEIIAKISQKLSR